MRLAALRATHKSPPHRRVAYATETMRFKVRLEDRRHWLLNSLRWGDSLMRRPSPTLKRVVSPFGSRQRGVTRTPHEKTRKCNRVRNFQAWGKAHPPSNQSANRSMVTRGKATCLPWRIFNQLYASQIDAATNNVAFSCGFVRLSCHAALPRPEG